MRGLASIAALAAAVCATGGAHADDAASGPVSGNVAVTSDYMFRGLTQAWGRPAIQGGADATAANGFAAGFWASSISGRSYSGGTLELDFYASYGRTLGDGWSWHAGLYGYVYPGGNLDRANPRLPSRSFDTLEANAALGWRWLTLKYNRALIDYFGADVEQGYRGDSRGTDYLQLEAALPPRGAWSLALHVGHLHSTTTLAVPLASGARNPGYSDFGATLKYRLAAHWSLAGGVTRATHAAFYRRIASLLNPHEVLDVGGTRGFLMLQGTF